MPPPASATLKPVGQWSRPPAGLIVGVRPNSPPQQHDRPLQQLALAQVAEQGAEGRVEGRQLIRGRWRGCSTWVSQPSSVTSTQRTPTSISRRAARQPRPNGVSP